MPRVFAFALVTLLGVLIVACDAPVTPNITLAPTRATPTQIVARATPSADAAALARVLDAMQVETRWLRGVAVNWETGEPNGKRADADTTHCSKFVAAAAKNLGVYILRPPDHPTVMLANAQSDWLNAQGAANGWTRIADGAQAQALANQGYLVVASLKSPDPKRHGHIAIVRPSAKSAAEIQKTGPQIIQAGIDNLNSASLKEGFKHHPGAFKNGEIQFWAHAVVR
ncbi:MAG: hypothetical protein FJ009_11570 [Chloroflexi bacterium]|nr:hypothetical protein [Chloroflexota bacterium]